MEKTSNKEAEWLSPTTRKDDLHILKNQLRVAMVLLGLES